MAIGQNTYQINQQVRTARNLVLKRHVQALIDIYKDNWYHLIELELAKQVGVETFRKYQFLITQELNILKRIVNELSIVYKDPPKRCVVTKGKEINEDEELEETTQEDENYELSQKNTNKDFIMQECNRYTNLANNTLVKVTYRNDKLDYDLLAFNKCEVFVDKEDWKQIIAIKHYFGLDVDNYNEYNINRSFFTIQKYNENVKGISQNPLVLPYTLAKVWVIKDIEKDGIIEDGTEGEMLKGGMVYTVEPNEQQEIIVKGEEIPYLNDKGEPIMPFVLFQKVYPVERLLDFTTGNDIKDLNMGVALLLIYLNSVEKYQSFKQLVFNTDNPEALAKQGVKTGPADAIINPTKEGGGSVQVLDLIVDTQKKFEAVVKRIVNVLAGYGMSPQNFTMSADAASGFSLKISNIGKIEARQAQLNMYRQKEHELFEVEKIIWNYHNIANPIGDGEFEIDFAELSFPKDPNEQVKEDEFSLRHNLITEVDIIMRRNPDLTKEQAEEKWRENKAFNDAALPQMGLQPFQQPGQQGGFNATQKGQEQKGNQQQYPNVAQRGTVTKTSGSNRNVKSR